MSLSKSFQTALFAAAIFFAAGFSACKTADGNSSAVQPNPVATPFVRPTRDPNAVDYFESADQINRIKAAFTEKIGDDVKFISFQINENYAITKAQDPKKPENVDEYTYRDGAMEKVVPVKLSGPGKLEDNLINLNDVALDKIPELVREALARSKDLEGAKAVQVRVAPDIMKGKPQISVDIVATRKNAMLVSDEKGKIISYKTF